MALPTWDDDTILQFKGRWKALNRVSSSNDASSTEESGSGAAGSKSSDGGIQGLIAAAEAVSGSDLQYDTLYEGLSHLLYTQPGNPPHESLIRHLDGEDNRRSYYHEVTIPKKRGGERTLTVPEHPLKWLQRSLLTVFTHLFPRHECAHGFERGKSIVTHAEQHTNKQYVYTIDIKDFFPSINRNRVFGMLKAYPINASTPVARYLANLTCHDGCLPQGAPTSPLLSNLLCRRLDSRLFKWARQNGYTYSRYADDLTFSTNRDAVPDGDIDFIDKIIRDEGFDVNHEKRRLQPSHKRQMVTGLVVNEKVNLPREKIRGLRALLHNIETHGWLSQVNRTSLFDDAEEWRSYINGDLSRSAFRRVERRQRENNDLLNPSATLPRVDDVGDLREVLRGKIQFIGAVRGSDDALYQRLLRSFRTLSERLDRHQQGKATGGHRLSVETTDQQDSVDTHEEDTPKHYHLFKRWFSQLQKTGEDRLSVSEFREKLADWTDHSLEMTWLLDRTEGASSTVRHEAARIAHGLDTSPFETALFFQKFDNYLGFRGLLHSPSDSSITPAELIGACETLVEESTLPNGLQSEASGVLEACNNWVDVHPDRYPWPPEGEDDTAVKTNHLLPFKRHTRFNPRKREEALIPRLRTHAEMLQHHEVTFDFPRKGRRFRTHVPSVLPALKKILSSMAEHTRADVVHVSVDKISLSGFDGITISIWDEASFIAAPPELDSLLAGDTREVLYHQTVSTGLRGYARWTLIAPFEHEDGPTYEFDVMQNNRSEAPEHDHGVLHRITFPQ